MGKSFQSLYGWIKTKPAWYHIAVTYEFQSHYGWIKTSLSSIPETVFSGFNPPTGGLRQSSFSVSSPRMKVSIPLRVD